jgi:putative hydrolase of HD superfamily
MSETAPKNEKTPELKFAHLAPEAWDELGKLERTGWVIRGVKNSETVQEHTIALINLAAEIEGLSEAERDGICEMLEIHDWPEAIHGDEIARAEDPEERKRQKALKFENEHRSLQIICSGLGEIGKTILNLWLRFEQSPDSAAEFARQLDKFQAIQKSLEIEKTQGIPMFREFYDGDVKKITHPVLVERLDKLMAEWESLQ